MKQIYYRTIWGASILGMALSLTACEDNGSSASDDENAKNEADYIEEYLEDLPNCTSKREGKIAYVEDEDATYICKDNKWTEDSDESKGKSSTKNSRSSSSTRSSSSSSTKAKSSSSDNDKSSSSEASSSSENEPEFDYGTLIDNRDGQKYKTIKIGSQNWMAENLNFYNKETNKTYCFDDKNENCEKYGRLYTWGAAMDSAAAYSSPTKEGTSGRGCGAGPLCFIYGTVRGVCPEGWHLPKSAEVLKLYEAVGGEDIAGKKLKSKTGWINSEYENGDDSFGFNVMPAGYLRAGYTEFGYRTYFWTDEESGEGYAVYWNFINLKDSGGSGVTEKGNAAYVRCVEDTVVVPKVEYDSITDKRDGQVYKTVKIGKQTWMAENLNYNYNETKGKSYCYDDDSLKCITYGRLYNWSAAIAYEEEEEREVDDSEVIRGACPEGWHLPNNSEMELLLETVSASGKTGTMLKSTNGWWSGEAANGIDKFGFNLLPGGSRHEMEFYEDLGYRAVFWSWVIDINHHVVPEGLTFKNENAEGSLGARAFGHDSARSIRCIKNESAK